MSWHRTAAIVGLLVAGMMWVGLGWYHKLGYVDLIAAAARATEERRFDNRDLDRAEGNVLASKDLLAYNRGVSASAAGRSELAARHFQDVIARSQSPTLRAKAYYNLGNLLALEGNVRGAAEMYRGALRLDPSDWDAKSNLEMLYAQLGVSEGEGTKAALRQAREAEKSGDEKGQGGSQAGTAGI
ncbi:MAG: tetratricopeptide repeat protein [Candidatus Methylomirabilia bacterium]